MEALAGRGNGNEAICGARNRIFRVVSEQANPTKTGCGQALAQFFDRPAAHYELVLRHPPRSLAVELVTFDDVELLFFGVERRDAPETSNA